VKVIPSVFSEAGQPGDFGWMMEQPDYADALFIFNDNEEQFRAYVNDPTATGGYGCAVGGGNAIIRPYRCQNPPRAAGIPTGSHGSGYPQLSEQVTSVLDEALSVVKQAVASGRYQRLFYSAEPDGELATRIFRVGDDVKGYIVSGLRKLED
jgi:hypothetical protein